MRCKAMDQPLPFPVNQSGPYYEMEELCDPGGTCTATYYTEQLCHDASDCPGAQICEESKTNPNYGVTSFDNIGVGVLNIFIIITLEGWTDIMYMIRQVMDTNSHDFFFIVCIIVGNFFVINLMVAVQFTYLRQSLEEGKDKKKEINKITAPKNANPQA